MDDAQTITASGDVNAANVVLSSIGQRASALPQAVMMVADSQTVQKPTCPAGTTPRVFGSLAQIFDDGAGKPISAAQVTAADDPSNPVLQWLISIRVQTEDRLVTPPGARAMVVTSCS